MNLTSTLSEFEILHFVNLIIENNPVFKQFVKDVITPMMLTLIMMMAQSLITMLMMLIDLIPMKVSIWNMITKKRSQLKILHFVNLIIENNLVSKQFRNILHHPNLIEEYK